MDRETKLIIRELKTLEILKVFEEKNLDNVGKSSETSNNARNQGNDLYVNNEQHHTSQEHLKIFKCYSKSVCFAPLGSEELALAYGNRSALLLHLKKYDDCLRDVDRALAITRSECLRRKLSQRKDKCVQLLNLTIEVEKRRAEKRQESRALSDSNVDPEELIDFSKLSLEADNSCDLVEMRYNNKYGRYLIASRDIKIGEIILAQEPYVNSFNTQSFYTYCTHCLTVTYSGIPCDHCAWFIFCSEKCKKEAWEQYHDIECSCIFFILYFVQHTRKHTNHNVVFDGLCIRAMLKGIREAGSLDKLKEQLKSVDENTDKRYKGFYENGKLQFNKFISLYCLSHNIPESSLKGHAIFSSIALVCLAKFTNFFGNVFNSFSINKLLTNSDAIYVGALLLRLIKITSTNSYNVSNINEKCKYSRDILTCRTEWCCTRGSCISPFNSLTNHSCFPNARRCFGKNQKIILYAIQPIKTNSQIFDCYRCMYYDEEKETRMKALSENFYFTCDCIACKNNWPDLKNFSLGHNKSIKLNCSDFDLWKNYKDLIDCVEKKLTAFDPPLLSKLAGALEKSFDLQQPSIVTNRLLNAFMQLFEELYGQDTLIFNEC